MFEQLDSVQVQVLSARQKLNLGCGMHPISGWTNADLYSGEGIDKVFDCEYEWPIPANTLQIVHASHMLEHLENPRKFFKHAWRAMVPNGLLLLRLPYGGHRAAWWDIEHLRPWYAESFAFVQPGYAMSIGNPQHTDWAWPYRIGGVDLRLSTRWTRLMRNWIVRTALLPFVTSIPDAVEELFVGMSALKTPGDVQQCLYERPPNFVPTRLVCYEHQWRRTKTMLGNGLRFHVLQDNAVLPFEKESFRGNVQRKKL